MEALQRNTKDTTVRTLNNISSGAAQVRYKQAVPFVHIGYELLAQSAQIARLLEKAWFQAVWTANQLHALKHFCQAYETVETEFTDRMPDVPELLNHAAWVHFMLEASQALSSMDAD